ncbi:hypothetical protein RZS08_42695, partial [Arthrospira platensis SPKY1]|nr:hypothetical protein [Arthrospira platensis SPKY1]
ALFSCPLMGSYGFSDVCCSRRRGEPGPQGRQVLGKLTDGMVAARQEGQGRARAGGVMGHHFFPAQHLVALGDQRPVALGPGDGVGVQRCEGGHELGPKEEPVLGVVKA